MKGKGEDIEKTFIPSAPVDGKIKILHSKAKIKNEDLQAISDYQISPVTDKEIEEVRDLFLKNIKQPTAKRVAPPPKKKKKKKNKSKKEESAPVIIIPKKEVKPDMNLYQPLQLLMRCSFRTHENIYNYGIVAITPHYIFMCAHKGDNPSNKLQHIRDIHVMEVKKLYVGTNFQKIPFLMVRLVSRYLNDQKIPDRITFTISDTKNDELGSRVRCLTRFVYRNISLAYSNAKDFSPQLEAEDPSAFATPFNADLSPAQNFQFTYDALCSYENVPYNHEIVRYFHYQIINHNGVFNAGYLPLDFSDDSNMPILKEMIPIFRALMYVKYVFGVVCDHVYRPEIFKAVSFQLILSQEVRFLHLSHCGATTGLKELANSIRQNRHCRVEYFDFSGNVFTDFRIGSSSHDHSNHTFFEVFRDYPTDVIYLNFNFCQFKDTHLLSLFSAMKECSKLFNLKYLHIAGSQLIEGPKKVLGEYFSAHSTLKSLDIGDVPEDIEDVLKMLHSQPLECLYLYNDPITKSSFDELIKLIDKKKSLYTLDISNTGLSPDQVSRIVDSMSSRHGHMKLILRANNLKINGSGVQSLMRGFLNGQLDRWEKLSFDSNGMKKEDLVLLIPLFHQMVCLKELSLSENFDYTMPGIEMELCNLLRIPHLKILRIMGNDEHYLGPKGRPLLVSIALSYLLRKTIGGLSINEIIDSQEHFADSSLELIMPHLIQLGPEDSPKFEHVLREKLKRIMSPFLIEKKKEDARKEMTRESFREIIKELLPLVRIVGSSIRCEEPTSNLKKRIGHITMSILEKWRDLTDRDPTKDDSSLADDLFGSKADPGKTWLEMASNLAPLEELDIRYNKIELSGIKAVTELIKVDKELRGVEIDGCNMNTVSSIVNFVDAVCEQKHLTKMSFPVDDMNNLVKNAKDSAKRVVEHDLRIQQLRMIKAIDKNRSEAGEFADLPFEPIPEIKEMIIEHTSKMEEYLPSHSLRTHSGICEDFRRQLVYLEEDKDGYLGLPDDYRIQDVGRMEEYSNFTDYLYHNQSLDLKQGNLHSFAIKKRYDEFEYDIVPSQLTALQIMKNEKKATIITREDKEVQVPDEDDNQVPVDISQIRNLFLLPSPQTLARDMTTEELLISDDDDEEISETTNEQDIEDDEMTKDAPNFDTNALKKPSLYTRASKEVETDSEEEEEDSTKQYKQNWGRLTSSFFGKIDTSVKLSIKDDSDDIEPPPD
ncbi:hypothetical protein TRFO_19499 [Tritrichomonas foetus]|uniref:Leucine Rich Repeat family protein n=1 Tax=Tritrichomonas foetus TaxID=1144522 RepID=A0A1J4KNL9_9EUKA|nr:hypothetical protein TRFO_19499 [Tritrichomonas foetus]|eukprot:OHT11005.1 hypothetical protein TRFO_19499 [Tritrichomonas foetus]